MSKKTILFVKRQSHYDSILRGGEQGTEMEVARWASKNRVGEIIPHFVVGNDGAKTAITLGLIPDLVIWERARGLDGSFPDTELELVRWIREKGLKCPIILWREYREGKEGPLPGAKEGEELQATWADRWQEEDLVEKVFQQLFEAK